jgi:hypothetical protein
VQRLNDGGPFPRTATILVPVFIVCGVAMLCVSCCMPCFVMMTRMALEEELQKGAGGVPGAGAGAGKAGDARPYSSRDRLVLGLDRQIAHQPAMASVPS